MSTLHPLSILSSIIPNFPILHFFFLFLLSSSLFFLLHILCSFLPFSFLLVPALLSSPHSLPFVVSFIFFFLTYFYYIGLESISIPFLMMHMISFPYDCFYIAKEQILSFFFSSWELRTKSRVLGLVGKRSMTELNPQPRKSFLLGFNLAKN